MHVLSSWVVSESAAYQALFALMALLALWLLWSLLCLVHSACCVKNEFERIRDEDEDEDEEEDENEGMAVVLDEAHKRSILERFRLAPEAVSARECQPLQRLPVPGPVPIAQLRSVTEEEDSAEHEEEEEKEKDPELGML